MLFSDMAPVTITAEGYEIQVLRDALSDYRRFWQDLLREKEMGLRPNMSGEGAKLMLEDCERLMEKVSSQM